MPKRRSLVERFWENVEMSAGCWEWKGAIASTGYGVTSELHKAVGAHRVSYELHYGPVPEGLFICHTCDNRRCVNPAHLFAGTPAENIHDALSKDRMARGERSGASRLKGEQVSTIRRRLVAGEPQVALAHEYGVATTTINHIHHRRTWRHVN